MVFLYHFEDRSNRVLQGGKSHYFRHLAPDPADPLPGQEYPQPLPVETEEEETWEVKDIVDVKRVGKAWKYEDLQEKMSAKLLREIGDRIFYNAGTIAY
ncbi:hypothetical protein EPUS_09454 [Endocarpon pusillum Z07020]|uniref:Uncharacterized protein n=1 Tax=Endocarpon pusillum (strain Z07020 / HMAS-L-300199) TaxID=1263415 RepID=U1GWV2_ENDPU|nr:uncharacterized protein EPUS_09454 [Endocarpon pusillum Z07020]ERF76978.1 hypothetical protein EPUS_09454 [Endocarpon pusillum Z07020]